MSGALRLFVLFFLSYARYQSQGEEELDNRFPSAQTKGRNPTPPLPPPPPPPRGLVIVDGGSEIWCGWMTPSAASSPELLPPPSDSRLGHQQQESVPREDPELEPEHIEDSKAPPPPPPPPPSFWSSLVSSTIAVIESKADSLGRTLGVANSRKVGESVSHSHSHNHSHSQNRWNLQAVRRVLAGSGVRRLLGSGGSHWHSSSTSDIWLLGACYPKENPDADTSNHSCHGDFLADFSSRIWLTYRKGFAPIGTTKFTSDVGWGCMIRSGQMLLAQALVCHYLGRSWRKDMSKPKSREYLGILLCFGDCSSSKCIFSIHNIVQAGGPYGVVTGSWLGPYVLCRTLEAIGLADREQSLEAKQKPMLPMVIYVVSGDADGERGGAPTLCINDIKDFCSRHVENPGDWPPILLMVPLVLGLDKVNPRYLPLLWATFTFPQSVGIAGGKPGASTYLVGVQGDQVLYLDPHEVQQFLTVSTDDLEVDTNSYHCSVVRQMPLNSIDPSLAIGFYCHNQEDFEDFCARASELEKDSNGAPMFTVVESSNKSATREGHFHEPNEEIDMQMPPSADFEDQADDGWQIL